MVVSIWTVTGTEDVIVLSSRVDANGVEVGFIRQKGAEFLVGLPRETLRGRLARAGAEIGDRRLNEAPVGELLPARSGDAAV